jgi:hypothetical protein
VKRGSDIHDHCADLRERSARLRVKVATLRRKHRQISDQIAAQSETEAASGGAVYDTQPLNPHDVAMEALRLIRAIIDPFPIEWQVAIVKALTARTILKAREQTRPPTTTLSA